MKNVKKRTTHQMAFGLDNVKHKTGRKRYIQKNTIKPTITRKQFLTQVAAHHP